MPSAPDITELWGNFKNLVKKITYDKTEVDDKLSEKSNINHTHTTLAKSADIPSNADLNDYTTTGFYLCTIGNTSTLLNRPSNLPSGGGLRLEVFSQANGVTQIIRSYGLTNNQVRMYFRHFLESNDVWTDWQQVVTTNNVSLRQVDNTWVGLPIYCSIKNGFAFLTWKNPFQYLNSNGHITQIGVYFDLGYVAIPESDNDSIYSVGTNWKLKIDRNGLLQGWVDQKDAWAYGTMVYPTLDTSLPYPDD